MTTEELASPRAAGDAEWRERAVERSLGEARAKAISRSDRFLRAAAELLAETGGTDFTVQDLVERSRLSLRSFYQHFAGKDELLLALFEEVISAYAARLRLVVARYDDPVDQLRAYVVDLYATAAALGSEGRLLPRALTLYHQRLAGTRPPEVVRALRPQVELARQIIEDGAALGRFRSDVEPRHLATILSQTLIGVGHMNVLGTHVTGERIGQEQLWAFCLAGVSPPGGPTAIVEEGTAIVEEGRSTWSSS